MLKKKIDFKKKAKEIEKNYLAVYAQEILTIIINRTRRGFDKKGKQFKPYKKTTIDIKGSSIVNLTDTGKMLDQGLTYKKITNGLRLYLSGSREAGLSNNDVAFRNKKRGREFLGLTKQEIKEYTKKLSKIYKDILK